MNRMYITEASVRSMLHNSESFHEFLVKLYSAVVTDDWDQIETFNSYPQANNKTITRILELCHEKFNDPYTVNFVWLNKGFSINNDLEDWFVGIPDNLYTLKAVRLDHRQSVEDFFNEDEYDERNKIQEDL